MLHCILPQMSTLCNSRNRSWWRKSILIWLQYCSHIATDWLTDLTSCHAASQPETWRKAETHLPSGFAQLFWLYTKCEAKFTSNRRYSNKHYPALVHVSTGMQMSCKIRRSHLLIGGSCPDSTNTEGVLTRFQFSEKCMRLTARDSFQAASQIKKSIWYKHTWFGLEV